MTPIRVSLVVEGHREVKAVPHLFRRIAFEIDPNVVLEVQQPIRRPRSSLVQPIGELERATELAALKARPRGGVFIILDSDDECPAELAPTLMKRAVPRGMGLPVFVILPQREFEAWFLAAAESIRGKRGLPDNLTSPEKPEAIRGAKEWLRERMRGRVYSETIDQPALAASMDLKLARASASFDKCCRDVRRLIEQFAI